MFNHLGCKMVAVPIRSRAGAPLVALAVRYESHHSRSRRQCPAGHRPANTDAVRSFPCTLRPASGVSSPRPGASDEIDEHAEERQEENEHEPESLRPAAVVPAADVVDERPQDHEDHEEERSKDDVGHTSTFSPTRAQRESRQLRPRAPCRHETPLRPDQSPPRQPEHRALIPGHTTGHTEPARKSRTLRRRGNSGSAGNRLPPRGMSWRHERAEAPKRHPGAETSAPSPRRSMTMATAGRKEAP